MPYNYKKAALPDRYSFINYYYREIFSASNC